MIRHKQGTETFLKKKNYFFRVNIYFFFVDFFFLFQLWFILTFLIFERKLSNLVTYISDRKVKIWKVSSVYIGYGVCFAPYWHIMDMNPILKEFHCNCATLNSDQGHLSPPRVWKQSPPLQNNYGISNPLFRKFRFFCVVPSRTQYSKLLGGRFFLMK